MTMWNLRITMLALLATLGLVGTASALSVPGEDSAQQASGLVESLSAAPPDVQSAALRVAAEPALLLQLEGIQSWSSRSLVRIIDAEPEPDREDLAVLSDYPGVVEDIVDSEARSPEALESLAAAQPTEIRASILTAGTRSFAALSRMRDLQRETESAFSDLVDELDRPLAEALVTLADEPAALQALQADLTATIALGEAWERDPFAVEAMLREGEVPSDARAELGDSWDQAEVRRFDEPTDSIEVYVQPTVSYRVSRPWSWYWAPYYAYGSHYGRHGYGYNSHYGYSFYYGSGHNRHHGNDNHHRGHKGGDHGKKHGHDDKGGDHGKGNGHNQDKGSDRDGRDSHANGRTAQKRRLKRNLRDLVASEPRTNGRRSSDRTEERRARQRAGTKALRTSSERAAKPSKTRSSPTKKRATKTNKRSRKKSKTNSRGGGKRKGRGH